MEKLSFLKFELFRSAQFNLTVQELFIAAFVIAVAVFSFIWLRKYMAKGKILGQIKKENRKRILNFIRFILFVLVLDLVLKIVGVNAHRFLQYEVLHTDKVSLNFYNVMIFLVILFVTKLSLYILEIVFADKVKTKKLEQGESNSIFQIIKYLVWVIAMAFFLDSLGFRITFIIASLSALLVGLGLGIQHLFNDIISGLIILFDRSLKVGDIVEIQGETIGRVEEIHLRVSKIISREDVVIIIPNSKFTSENVINWSHNSKRTRFGVKVGVAYGSDVALVKKLLAQAAEEHPKIESYPPPLVFFRDFGDSSLDFEVMFFTEESFRVEMTKSDLRFAINEKFAQNGVTIPFPQRDVHFYPKS